MSLTRVFSLQVNDFLSGAAPLNLTMRLGDHMMLIQVREMMMMVIRTRNGSRILRVLLVSVSTCNRSLVYHNHRV